MADTNQHLLELYNILLIIAFSCLKTLSGASRRLPQFEGGRRAEDKNNVGALLRRRAHGLYVHCNAILLQCHDN